MKNKLLLLAFSLIFSLSILANDNSAYNKGWTSFLENNNSEARKYFEEASNNSETKADAFYSLAILEAAESRMDLAFSYLEKYYEASSDYNAHVYASIHMPYAYTSRGVLKKNKLDFLEKLLINPKTSGYLKASISNNLGHHYHAKGDFKNAKEIFASSGVIYDWQILGSFDNTSGGGFNKNWEAVEKAKATDSFTNNMGASVNWFTPKHSKEDGWFYYTYYMDGANTINYSQTFVTSPIEQEIYLNIGVSGSLKAWVNDAQVLEIEDERNCGIDLYRAKVKLNAGANRLLVQLGSGEVESSNHYVRFADEDGNSISGLGISAQYANYTKDNTKRSTKSLEFIPENYFEKKIENGSKNILDKITLAELYIYADKTDEAIILLSDLKKEFAKSSYLSYRLQEAYVRAKNQTYSTREEEAIKTNDPDSYYGFMHRIGEAQSSNKVNDVKDLYAKLTNLYGSDGSFAKGVESWIVMHENDNNKRVEIAKKRYEEDPNNYYSMNTLYGVMEYTLKDSKASKKLIESYCKNNYNPNAMQTLSNIYMKEGNVKAALKLLEDRLNIMPYAAGYKYQYASILHQMQRYNDALKIANEVVESTPYVNSGYNLRADIYKSMGKNQEAIENYKQAFEYHPANFEAVKQLRLLGDMKEMEDYFPKQDLDSLIAKTGNPEDYPEDHSVIILYSEQVLFHEKGSQEARTRIAVKILNKGGIEAWKEYGIGTYSGQSLTLDKSEVIKANGQKVQAETSGGHIVFTDLEIGDVLHLDYRIKSYYYGKLAQVFAGSYLFQYSVPTMNVNFALAMPDNIKFDHKILGDSISAKVSKVNDRTLYTWELNNQPSVKNEPLMPSLQDVAPGLIYSNFPSWKYVREWYQDVTTNKFKSDYLLKETVATVLKGHEDASDLEKAKIFYNHILETTSYLNASFMQDNQIPQRASRTISTRLGDCKDVATLFVAMCREVGIDANVVLFLTKNNSLKIMELPNNFFNHAIAELNVEGKRYYLELTSNKLPFGSLFGIHPGSAVLSIREPFAGKMDILEELDMPIRTLNRKIRNTKIKLDENAFDVDFQSTHYGSFSSSMRDDYAEIGVEEQTKVLNDILASSYRNKTRLTDLKFENLNNLEDHLSYTYKLKVENMVQEVAGMNMFKLVWRDNVGSLEELARDDRKYPFLNWAYNDADEVEETISFELPKGKKFVEIPKDVKLDCPNASYSLSFDSSQAGVIKIHRKFVTKTSMVSVEQYADFAKFMREASLNDNKQYVIQ